MLKCLVYLRFVELEVALVDVVVDRLDRGQWTNSYKLMVTERSALFNVRRAPAGIAWTISRERNAAVGNAARSRRACCKAIIFRLPSA